MAKGDLVCRIEYYHDKEPEQPEAWQAFSNRWSGGYDPVEEGYQTVGFDSLTLMSLRCRHDKQFRTHRKTKGGKTDPRRWWAEATNEIERKMMGTAASLRCNVVLTAHVSEDKDEVHGTIVYNPMASGRLAKGLPAGFVELYRAYVETDKQGNYFVLQTEKDNRYNAATQILAPDGCEPDYAKLWKNWNGKTKPPLHVLVYGDAGAKKSRFLATFPKPILVQLFDPFGKDMPYLQLGKPQGVKWSRTLGIYVQNVVED